MSEMMICPKAKECKLKCIHKKPHHFDDVCCVGRLNADCLICNCIPYIPEQPKKPVCPECGQTDIGQQGEYFCKSCGLPKVWDKEYDMRYLKDWWIAEINGALARGYCTKENEKKVLDPELIKAMCAEVISSLTIYSVIPADLKPAEMPLIKNRYSAFAAPAWQIWEDATQSQRDADMAWHNAELDRIAGGLPEKTKDVHQTCEHCSDYVIGVGEELDACQAYIQAQKGS